MTHVAILTERADLAHRREFCWMPLRPPDQNCTPAPHCCGLPVTGWQLPPACKPVRVVSGSVVTSTPVCWDAALCQPAAQRRRLSRKHAETRAARWMVTLVAVHQFIECQSMQKQDTRYVHLRMVGGCRKLTRPLWPLQAN